MVVYNSLKASTLYEKIFDLLRIEMTGLARGEHEVIISLYDVRFHMLDENPQFGLKAPDFRRYNR